MHVDKPASFEFAKGLFAREDCSDFLGHDVVNELLGHNLKPEDVPPIPFTEKRLIRAKELEQHLVLDVDTAPDGEPLTLRKLDQIFWLKTGQPFLEGQGEYDLSPTGGSGDGKVVSVEMTSKRAPIGKDEWLQGSFMDERMTRGWRLATMRVPVTTELVNIYGQTLALADYLRYEVYKGQKLPNAYQDAADELERVAAGEFSMFTGNSEDSIVLRQLQPRREQLEARIMDLKINALFRETPVQAAYRIALHRLRNNTNILSEECTLTRGHLDVLNELRSVTLWFTIGVASGGSPWVKILPTMFSSYVDFHGVCFSEGSVPK